MTTAEIFGGECAACITVTSAIKHAKYARNNDKILVKTTNVNRRLGCYETCSKMPTVIKLADVKIVR